MPMTSGERGGMLWGVVSGLDEVCERWAGFSLVYEIYVLLGNGTAGV